MSFFDDDAEVTQVTAPTPRPRRGKRNRSRLRIQRLSATPGKRLLST